MVETIDEFGQVGFVETMGAPQVQYAPTVAGQARVIGGGIQNVDFIETMGAPQIVETVDQFGQVGFVEEFAPAMQTFGGGGFVQTVGASAFAAPPMSYAAPVSYGQQTYAAPVSYGQSYGAATPATYAAPMTSFAGARTAAPMSYGTVGAA